METHTARTRPSTEPMTVAIVPESLARRAGADRRWHPVTPWRAPDDDSVELPPELGAWPPRWRYRVAGLEAEGMSRRSAIRRVRREVAALTVRAA